MEAFGARSAAPLDTCLAEVEQSNIYLGILGFRLGSIDETTGKSFTQREYEKARELNLEILVYLRDEESSTLRRTDMDFEPILLEKLASFKRSLRENHTVDTFDAPADLATKLRRDLQRHLSPRPHEGSADEFEQSRTVAKAFMLLPQPMSGNEIRLQIRKRGRPFAASRALCHAFNLPYGATIGIDIEVVHPTQWPIPLCKELFAAGQRAVALLERPEGEILDLYVRLQFTPHDLPRTRARFFGGYVNVGPDPDEEDDPNTQYELGEGRVMLLFSKFASEEAQEKAK